jgi:hypothetical protein
MQTFDSCWRDEPATFKSFDGLCAVPGWSEVLWVVLSQAVEEI